MIAHGVAGDDMRMGYRVGIARHLVDTVLIQVDMRHQADIRHRVDMRHRAEDTVNQCGG
jgi:hypothetical protein